MNHHQAIELLRSIGGEMSNVLYNLGQHKRREITEREGELFYALAKKWDAALSEHASAPAPTSEPGARDAEFSQQEIANWQKAALDEVLSREGQRKYRHREPVTLDPSDLRDLMDIAVGRAFAARDLATPASPASPAVPHDTKLMPRTLPDSILKAGIVAFQSGYRESDTLADWRAFYAAIFAAVPAVPLPAPVAPSQVDLLEVARQTGLRHFMHGVNATDARRLLKSFVDALAAAPQVAQASPTVPAPWGWAIRGTIGRERFQLYLAGDAADRDYHDHASNYRYQGEAVHEIKPLYEHPAPEASPLVDEAQRIVAGKVEAPLGTSKCGTCEGKGVVYECIICGASEPRTGTCSGPHDSRSLCAFFGRGKAQGAAE